MANDSASLRSKYRELHKLIAAILLKEWDPLGVAEIPEARDEYDGYVENVISAMQEGADANGIAVVLEKIAAKDLELHASKDLHQAAAIKCAEAWAIHGW